MKLSNTRHHCKPKKKFSLKRVRLCLLFNSRKIVRILWKSTKFFPWISTVCNRKHLKVKVYKTVCCKSHCVNILMLSLTEQSFCDFTARDESEVVIHSDDAFAPVGFLHFKRMHVEQKELKEVCAIMAVLFQLILTNLLTEHNWCTSKYWPKVTTVETKTIVSNDP